MASSPHLRRPDDSHVRQEWNTVEENELRLDRDAAARVVEVLNDELSGLYILFNQVRKHDWVLDGAQHRPVTDFLEDAADRLSAVTDDLALRVHALGGVPVCGPMGMRQHAPLHIEAEHVYDVRTSLSNDLDGYATLAVRFRDGIDLAKDVGDETTVELLREHLKTLEEDAHTIERFLADDTLIRQESLR